jgi:hypothetical protein
MVFCLDRYVVFVFLFLIRIGVEILVILIITYVSNDISNRKKEISYSAIEHSKKSFL